jgi:hypothetical protein
MLSYPDFNLLARWTICAAVVGQGSWVEFD